MNDTETTPDDLANADEAALFEWGRQAYLNEPRNLGGILRQLITLTTALLAGSVAFLNSLPREPRALLILGLMGALASALIGVYPIKGAVRLDRLDELEELRGQLVENQSRCLFWSAACLIFAFLSAYVGLFCWPTEPPR